jgi:hypothetical protein
MWFWFDETADLWHAVIDDAKIEKEYIDHLKGKRCGQQVYHCFGNGWTACVDYDTMTTYCGSGRCRLTHEKNGLTNDHMTYKLKRIV